MYLYPYTQITSQIFFNDCTQALITRFLLDVMTFIYYFLPKFSAMLKIQLENNSRESTKTIFFYKLELFVPYIINNLYVHLEHQKNVVI